MLTILFALACSSPEAQPPVRAVAPTSEARHRGLVAAVSASTTSGDYPLDVDFDATGSVLGGRVVQYQWSFGDGAVAVGGSTVHHTYVGPGDFTATLTLVGGLKQAADSVAISVSEPPCPVAAAPVLTGTVADNDLDEVSGIAASPSDPGALWVHEDSGNAPILVALDATGHTLARHTVLGSFADWEDIAAAVDPVTGVPTLFLADTGDNAHSRADVAVWVMPEPSPRASGDVTGTRMALTYPDGPHDAESLLVDPITFDLYIVSKETTGTAKLYVKRAPHEGSGPFVLESLGTWPTLGFTATGGDVSADGTRIVLRDYTSTAHLWVRDGYGPLEDAFASPSCAIAIHSEFQGEAIGFTADGASLLTTSEGLHQPIYQIGL